MLILKKKKKLQILAKRNCLPKNPLKPQINQVNKLQYILSSTKPIIFLWKFSSLTLIFFWSPGCFHYYIYFPHSTSKSSSDILWVPTPTHTHTKYYKSLYSFSQVKINLSYMIFDPSSIKNANSLTASKLLKHKQIFWIQSHINFTLPCHKNSEVHY